MKIFSKKQSRGSALIEFALVGNVFFLLIFGIYQLGLVLTIHDGLRAGMFYATRAGIIGASQANVQTAFTNAYNAVAFNSFASGTLTFTTYTSMTNRNSNSGGSSQFGGTGSIVVYTATEPFTISTNYLGITGSSKRLTFSMTVQNENF